MMEALIEETTKETTISEKDCVPNFFTSLPEAKESLDDPVEKAEGYNITLITRNEALEGDIHPMTGVPFRRKSVELPNGETVEGVFAEFDSVFEVEISQELYCESDYKQFKICNEKLCEALETDVQLKSKFTKEQAQQIREGVQDGTSPEGYVWHHDATPGKIQLAPFEAHASTGHTGGRTVWGGGNENR